MDPSPVADGSASFEEFQALLSFPPTLPNTPDPVIDDDHQQIPNMSGAVAGLTPNPQPPTSVSPLHNLLQPQYGTNFGVIDVGYSSPASWSDSWMNYLNADETPDDHGAGQSSRSSLHLSPKVKKNRTYKRFTVEDIRNLIQGVERFGRSWVEIEAAYFKGSGRMKDQLKEKWRHVMKSADKQTDITLKELYTRAKMADVEQSRAKKQQK